MSILYISNVGWLISHENIVNSFYKYVEHENGIQSYKILTNLFQITRPFKKLKATPNRKRKLEYSVNVCDNFNQLRDTINHVKALYLVLRVEIQSVLQSAPDQDILRNDRAIELSTKIYDESGKACITNSIGENQEQAKHVLIGNHNYVFPANCKFFCKDIAEIERYLIDVKYNLIVLDPPWWNKYVRRKKAKTDHGYEMMYNNNLKDIPIENLLEEDGLVVVWCTNSLQHLQTLQNEIFNKWQINFVTKWYWIKITKSGEPICGFSEPPGKQPFEQIVFGCRNRHLTPKIEEDKLVVSVPSALHSHKPPLLELLKQYLPENPKCLELFARYLVPNWTSWGLEAARFQHESLYELV